MEEEVGATVTTKLVRVTKVEAGVWLRRHSFLSKWASRCGSIGRLEFDGNAKVITLEFKEQQLELSVVYRSVQQCIQNRDDRQELFIALRYPPEVWYRGDRRTEYPLKCPDRRAERSVLGECRVLCLTLQRDERGPVPEELTSRRIWSKVTRATEEMMNLTTPNFSIGIDDRLLYALDCLLSAGFVKREDIDQTFLQHLRSFTDHRVELAEGALYLLYREHRRIYNLQEKFNQAMQREPSNKRTQLPDGYALVRSVHITPSRLLFFPPCEEQANRVLRQWRNIAPHFIRVSFGEEDCSQLRMIEDQPEVVSRFKRLLKNGIKTPSGSHNYVFLAYSNSQLRRHSCWFFSPTPDVNRDHIIKQMGSIKESSVARYAARMALWFSTGHAIRKLPKNQLIHCPDVERNGYVFSDGIGIVSRDLAAMIAQKLGLAKTPAAFQIRCAGLKGVLSLDLECKPGIFMKYRPSMKKFESNDYRLEVLGWSRKKPGYLNHQVISILSALGVKDKMNFLEKITKCKKAASACLQSTYKCLYKMLTSGFQISTNGEPYLVSCLRAIQKKRLQDLKMRARIYVPMSQTAIGVMDESGLLKPGEIFFRRSTEKGHKVTVGNVVVLKCPALAPGDVRRFKAVNISALHDLVDCLVFPQQGDRPHPNELAGSDLDGDEYFISWDPNLLFKRNAEAANYSSASKLAVEQLEQVTPENVITFFLHYIQNDVLGQVANLHKVYADIRQEGVMSYECLELAEMHSIAVDFGKTGEPVDKTALQKYRSAMYPDFMGIPPAYTSNKILGELYRNVEIPQWKPLASAVDDHLKISGYEAFLDDAKVRKKEYDIELRGIMWQYGIKTEAEAITGQVFKFHAQEEHGKRFFNVKQILRKRIERLLTHYRAVFLQQFGRTANEPIPLSDMKMRQKASAWYMVCYCRDDPPGRAGQEEEPEEEHDPEEDEHKAAAGDLSQADNGQTRQASRKRKQQKKKKKTQPPMLSFAWIMFDILCEIKHERVREERD